MANYNKSFNFRNGVQVDNDNFIVNANGLVGIGTSIPREFLDVYGTAKVTGLVTTTNLYVTGIATLSNLRIENVSISSGIVTASTGIVTYYGNGQNLLNLPTSQWINVNSGFGYTSIYAAGNVGVATTNPIYTFQVGANPITSNGVGFNSTGDVYISGIVTARNATITNLTSTASTITSLTVSGTSNIGTLNAVSGVVTTISGTNLNYSGTSTLNTLNATTGIVTTLSGTNLTYGTANITTLNSTITGTITNLTNTNLTSTASTITYLNNTNLKTTGVATIQTLKTVDGSIAYFTGENGSYTGNVNCNSLNAVSGVVTTLSGTTLTYGGTGTFNTLNATTGIVTTLSGTNLTYTIGTIANLSSTNINATGIITATNGFRGDITGTASSATQLVTPRNFSITGSFVTASGVSFNGTENVAIAATIAPNSIVLGTYTSGNYVKSISGVNNQIVVFGSPSVGGQPQIGLADNVSINSNLYVENNVGIGTTIPIYNLQVSVGNNSGVGISTLGNINATGIITTNTLNVGTGVTAQSGVVTAINGFTSGIGTAVKITTVDNKLIFTVVGVGSTSLTLS